MNVDDDRERARARYRCHGRTRGAVVNALTGLGVAVRALVRAPSSPAATALAARGVELAEGDFDDPASLGEATSGAVAVFSVQLPPVSDPHGEFKAGIRLIEAAAAAGVDTFVHTSVARAGDQENFIGWTEGRWWQGYWTNKAAVNDAVKTSGFPHWVILKPAFMMDNFIAPKAIHMFPSLAATATIDTVLAPHTRLDLIAAADVGRFAAAAFVEPQRWDRREIDLAANSMTMDEVAAAVSAATGRVVVARSLSPEDALAAGNPPGLVESQQWAEVEGYKVDLQRARSHGVTLESFDSWALRHSLEFDIASGGFPDGRGPG